MNHKLEAAVANTTVVLEFFIRTTRIKALQRIKISEKNQKTCCTHLKRSIYMNDTHSNCFKQHLKSNVDNFEIIKKISKLPIKVKPHCKVDG